jgi:hypothetical protein
VDVLVRSLRGFCLYFLFLTLSLASYRSNTSQCYPITGPISTLFRVFCLYFLFLTLSLVSYRSNTSQCYPIAGHIATLLIYSRGFGKIAMKFKDLMDKMKYVSNMFELTTKAELANFLSNRKC